MFRKTFPIVTEDSSFHSGKASILREDSTLANESYDQQYFYESAPYQYQYGDNLNRPLPPTPSLERTSTQTTSSSSFSFVEEDHQLDKTDEPLTLESMSAVIAAAVQMSSGGIKSSLSMGHASIRQPQQQQQQQGEKRRFSLFSWKKQHQQPAVTEVSPRSSCSTMVDDGREELAHRGIHIKEIKTTLKPMVIPTNVSHPMPTVTMERPGFARINY